MSDGAADEWEATLDDLSERRSAARAMGGEERLAKHRASGKLDARARVEHLLDRGSFQELGTLVGGSDAPADAIVMGSGRIDGRPVMVAAEDFTVKAGTISQAANAKRYRVAEIALLDRVPLVMMLDGAGYRADGRAHARTPTDLLAQAPLLGARAARDRGARLFRRSRSAGRADVGLHGDEQACGDLHGRSARGPRVARGDRHEGGARRPVGRGRERSDPQRGGRRPRPPSTSCAGTSGTSRPRPGRTRPTPPASTPMRVSSPRCSRSCRATAGGSTRSAT